MKLRPLLLFLILSNFSYAQNLNLEWLSTFGSLNVDESTEVMLDRSGNVYTVGIFQDSIDADPSSGVSLLQSNGSGDIFIQKLDENGNFLWANSYGGSGVDIANAIVSDALGNIVVTGVFQDSIQFDSGQTASLFVSSGSYDIFILKLDSNGNFMDVKIIGGVGKDIGNTITTDDKNNYYVSGVFSGTVNFNPGVSTYNQSSNGQEDVFVLKLDENFNVAWVKSFGGTLFETSKSIVYDGLGYVYVTGEFQNTVDFNPSSSTNNLTSNGFLDAFLQKLDTNGNYVWAKSIGGINGDIGNEIEIDHRGDVYLTGRFIQTVDFDPGVGVANLTAPSGNSDAYLLKLNANGQYLWAINITGTNYEEGRSIDSDSQGNLYLLGYFLGTPDADPSSNTYTLTGNGNRELFLVKLDSSGSFIMANSIGGVRRDGGISIKVDSKNNLFLSGYFESTVDFDPDTAFTNSQASKGFFDVFTLKLSQSQLTGLHTKSQLEKELVVFPNPSTGVFHISLASFNTPSIRVLDIQGNIVFSKEKVNARSYSLNLEVASGYYVLEIRSAEGVIVKKLLKN